MKFYSLFKPLIVFLPILVIQLVVIPFIEIGGIVPDLILILLVFYTLQFGQIFGTVFGSAVGLIFDLVSGSILGSMMFSKTLSGFIAGYFYNENKINSTIKSYLFVLIVLLCSTIDSMTMTLISQFELSQNLFSLFIDQALTRGFYTSVVSILIVAFYPKRSFE